MKIYIDVSKIKIFQMELLENFMAKNDIEYARIYTIESIDERDKEIERLKEENKKYNKWIESLNKDNHRLNNIIKEVREYIKETGQYLEDIKRFKVDVLEPNYLDILEILDKVN